MVMGWVIAGLMYGIILGWVIYEFWRAPLTNESGQIIKKQKKSGSYSDLEKLGRGRSKH
jgi:hypothetical protein